MHKESLSSISHIISLGPNCMVAYQIRRFFNVSKGYPFDWWITPYDGLIKVIDFLSVDDLFCEKRIRITDDGNTVLNPDYNIFYHHGRAWRVPPFEREL